MANSQGADADDDDVQKKIAIFGNKQRLLSIDMKNKSYSECLERVNERVKKRECESDDRVCVRE